MTLPVTRSDVFKQHLSFIEDWDRKKNISYHLQYIEFLYKIGKMHKPRSTTRSLLIKTIVIEYFTVIEAILDALLCQLQVAVDQSTFVPIEIGEYTKADTLLKLSKKYRIINQDIGSQLGQIKSTRNRIHIKRRSRNQPLEYEAYTTELLQKHEKAFQNFLTFLFLKYYLEEKEDFPWPWKASIE